MVRSLPYLYNLAAFCVDEAQVGVPVAYVQPGRRLRPFPANIHGGPILLSGWALEPVNILLADLRVLRMGVGLLISSSEKTCSTTSGE